MNLNTSFQITFLIIIFNFCQGDQYKVTDQIFFDIESRGKYLGRITIGLFGEIVPKTVANFKQIATNGIDGKTYESSRFLQIRKRFMIQGGDIVNNDGTGSISIYGKFFQDENFKIKHNTPGIVSMANGGPNTNGCQFFITTVSTPWLDGINVAFGKVLKGQEIVHKIEHMKTYTDYSPVDDVIIIRSGLIHGAKSFYESNEPYELTLWAWIKAGWFPLSFSFGILAFFHWIMKQLDGFKSIQ